MKLVDIMNMSGSDLNKLTTSELKSVYRTLNRNIKARVTRIENAGLTGISPAIRYGRETGVIELTGKTTNMTHQSLRKAISQQRNFLNKKTSTVTGSKKYFKQLTKKPFKKEMANANVFDWDAYFKVYENMKREFASFMASNALSSDQIFDKITQVWNEHQGFKNWKEWDQEAYRQLFKDLYGYDPNDVDKMIDDIMGNI